jgi:hypothetical protein
MEPQLGDVIASAPRPSSWPPKWMMAVIALLVAALAATITVTVHYRGEVTSLRQQLRTKPAHRPAAIFPLRLSSTTTSLPSSGALHGEVMVIVAWHSGQQAQIELDAHITGASPDANYMLIGFDCNGSTGYQIWATGVTSAHGSGDLSGPAGVVSLSDQYWLYLSPSSGTSIGTGLHGSFTAARKFAAAPAGNPACS